LFVTHPVVTISLFLMSLYGLYFTPVFDYLMGTMWGHNVMLLHFLAIGFLYFWGVLGVDPSPRRATRGVRQFNGPVLRIFELFATVPFHAFFGVVVMMSVSLIVHFYAIPVPGWGIPPLQDQQLGGGIAWGFTEIPTLVVLGVLFLQWQSSEDRLNRRMDRAERRREGEREAYNTFLASLAARDAGEPR
jgi:putative copper resistance protein D